MKASLNLSPELVKGFLSNIKVSLLDAVEFIDDAVLRREPADRIADKAITIMQLFSRRFKGLSEFNRDSALSLIEGFTSAMPDPYYAEVIDAIKRKLGLDTEPRT